MKKYILIPLILMTGCASTPPNCLQDVAAAEVAVTQSYNTTIQLYMNGTISKPTAQKATKYTDDAKVLADSARPLCNSNLAKAEAALSNVASLITNAKLLTGAK